LISAWLTLRPTRPLSPASPLATPSPTDRKRPAGPSNPRVGRVFAGNTFSFSDHAFPRRPPPPSITATRAPLVSSVVSPMPPTPAGISPAPPLPPCRCLAPWMPPSSGERTAVPVVCAGVGPRWAEHAQPVHGDVDPVHELSVQK
jgi:hypothetical protein